MRGKYKLTETETIQGKTFSWNRNVQTHLGRD